MSSLPCLLSYTDQLYLSRAGTAMGILDSGYCEAVCAHIVCMYVWVCLLAPVEDRGECNMSFCITFGLILFKD